MGKVSDRKQYSHDTRNSINSVFVDEVKRFQLKYRCEDCVHAILPLLDCSLKYPNNMLKVSTDMAIYEDNEFAFCKDFELNVS